MSCGGMKYHAQKVKSFLNFRGLDLKLEHLNFSTRRIIRERLKRVTYFYPTPLDWGLRSCDAQLLHTRSECAGIKVKAGSSAQFALNLPAGFSQNG